MNKSKILNVLYTWRMKLLNKSINIAFDGMVVSVKRLVEVSQRMAQLSIEVGVDTEQGIYLMNVSLKTSRFLNKFSSLLDEVLSEKDLTK